MMLELSGHKAAPKKGKRASERRMFSEASSDNSAGAEAGSDFGLRFGVQKVLGELFPGIKTVLGSQDSNNTLRAIKVLNYGAASL